MAAILCGSAADIERCLRYPHALNERNTLGQSAVHLAVLSLTKLSQLLEAGIDVDLQDNRGRSPLVYTAAYGCTDSVILLLEARANPILEDPGSVHMSFLNYARMWHHWELIAQAVSYLRLSPNYSD